MNSSHKTLNQRILHADSSLPVTFYQLQVNYEDHREEDDLDTLVVSRIDLRRTASDAYYVLVHVAATMPTDSQEWQAICYLAVDEVPSTESHSQRHCLQSILRVSSRSKTATIPRAQVVDHGALPGDVCLRQHTFAEPYPLACVIAAGLFLADQNPYLGHSKPRSSWFAALLYWLMVPGGEKTMVAGIAADRAVEPTSHFQAAIDQQRRRFEDDCARRTKAVGWKVEVEELEKEVAREGRRMKKEKA